ncbi:unnamed protein product, partial [marine sediment metagenome]
GHVYMEVGNGHAYSRVDSGITAVLPYGTYYPLLEWRYIPQKRVEYYIDDVKIGEITENLPEGILYPQRYVAIYVESLVARVCYFTISLVEFWMRR